MNDREHCQKCPYFGGCYIIGPTGPIGSTGPTGPAPTLVIGTVTTGAPGSNASVTITPISS